ncbi:uncharacterized protein [Gossypium hirsutum]|uniref:Uncharacterized protein n=1 Tax=Gossypium hirsutum TaxID=3635 RepID=A0ABM2ZUX0_GOSHI|nr:uncharacterized protein LOC121215328 [Gossypium hirsutum]
MFLDSRPRAGVIYQALCLVGFVTVCLSGFVPSRLCVGVIYLALSGDYLADYILWSGDRINSQNHTIPRTLLVDLVNIWLIRLAVEGRLSVGLRRPGRVWGVTCIYLNIFGNKA